MRGIALALICLTLILSSAANADDLFPLDKIALGTDVNSVKAMGFDIDWAPFDIDSSESYRRANLTNGLAFARFKGALWDCAMLGIGGGRIESIIYASPLRSATTSRQLVCIVYRELLTRYGKPDQVFVATQSARNGPVFVWRRQGRLIAFMYTPSVSATDGKQSVGLQVMVPEVLAKRYKVVEVSPAELQRLTIDVAGIKPGPAATDAELLKEFGDDHSRISDAMRTSDVNAFPGLAAAMQDKWAKRDRATYGTLMAYTLSSWRSTGANAGQAVPIDLITLYAAEALSTYDPNRSDNITIPAQFVLVGIMYQQRAYSKGDYSDTEWWNARGQGARKWLQAWQRLDGAIDKSWDANEPVFAPPQLPSGVTAGLAGLSPELIQDPNLRREYERAVADYGRKVAIRCEQLELRSLRTTYGATISNYLSSTYSIAPRNDDERRQLVTMYVKDPATRKLFLSQ